MDKLPGLLNYVNGISPVELVALIAIVWVVCKEVGSAIKYIHNKQEEHKKELEEYHKSASDEEDKEKDINDRLSRLEEHSNDDYGRIKQMESHLFQIECSLKKLEAVTTDIIINDCREVILNAPSQVTDLSKHVSAEYYNNIFKTYAKYEGILKDNGLENGQAELSMEVVRSSWVKRAESQMFTEQLYLDSDAANEKIRTVGNNINLGVVTSQEN